jgi:hypothetical protein
MIANHPDVAEHIDDIDIVLFDPDVVRQSADDEASRLYYRGFELADFGDVQMCVVAVIMAPSPFVLTACFTDRIKQGVELWRRK